MLHIPILRKGNPYKSIDVQRVPHFKTRETFVEVSQANAGLIRRDLLDLDAAQARLAAFSTEQLIEMCRRAADYFMNDALPPHVDRLNIGPIPTMRIAWDQPHEGNLFEHLYARRAFQRAAAAA